MNKKYIEYLVLLVLLCLSFIYYLNFQYNTYIYDDAFITYRYAVNFAEGNGLVYNIGEHVWGTTSVLYALLLGCIKFVLKNVSVHIISQFISLLLFNLIFWYLYSKYNPNIYILTLIYLFLFFNEYVHKVIFSGMETMLIVFLLVLVMTNYSNKYVFFLISLLILGRVDVALVFIFTFFTIKLIDLFKHKISAKVLFRDLIFLTISIIVPFAITFLLFNNLVPNTILAKSIIYKDSVYASPFLFRLNQMRYFGFVSLVSIPVFIFIITNIYLIIYKKKEIEIKILFPALFSIYYFLLQVIFISTTNEWYIPVLTFNVIFVFWFLLENFGWKKIVIPVFIILIVFNIWNNYKYNSVIFGNNNDHLYNTEVYYVANMIPQKSKIFCGDIGVIGYFNNSYIYDFAGLVTPAAHEFNKQKKSYGSKGVTTDFTAIIKELKIVNPEYLNFREYPFYEDLINDDYIKHNFELIFDGKEEKLYKKNIKY